MAIHLALVNGRMRDETNSGHLASELFAAFLDGRLTGADRERAVRHFAQCAECRLELTELRGMLDARARKPRRWIASAVGIAAILAFAMIPRVMSDGGEGAARVRAENSARLTDAAPSIAVVTPEDGATVQAARLRLSWRSAGTGAAYTVTVQDSSGTEVWARTSWSDTTVSLPDDVRLRSGSQYFWSVDARRADGNTAKTGVRTFTVR